MNTAHNTPPNRLIHATSPYLLQHAYNPVDWHEWNDQALQLARAQEKPILVSIGYSSCHWCHVMERESFENPGIASLMNEFFVCIKVDREERPDIDQVYMEAVQAMGIRGGWPLHVFLTPDQKPFFGGTYFPPSAWEQVLTQIHKAFRLRRGEINHSAEELTRLISSSDLSKYKKQTTDDFNESLDRMYQHLERRFDRNSGGMENAPKFIMPSTWQWLMRYHYLKKKTEVLDHVNLTLRKIIYGGIYDQIGGGFARYSVDSEWFVPHFEKMLYDNAQLISLYSEAYQLTGNEEYRQAVYETFAWLQREMTSPQGGFYTALDADSEGVEGKFYLWTHQEVIDVLDDAAFEICNYYNITPEGNWEHGASIPFRAYGKPRPVNLAQHQKKLMHHRNKRVKPGLDTKIISGWNAMTISALVDASHAFNDPSFLAAAQKAMSFIESHLMEDTTLFRSWNVKHSNTEGFLDDYACMIQACLKLYEATFDERWLERTQKLTEKVIADFYDTEDGYFFYTGRHAEQLIARKKELFDNVIPSSNSVMAQNLLLTGKLLDRADWSAIGRNMIEGITGLMLNEPGYMANWACTWTAAQSDMAEVAIVGPACMALKNEFKKQFHPTAVVLGTATTSALPLLQNKKDANGQSAIFVCFDGTCKQPVYSVADAVRQLVDQEFR